MRRTSALWFVTALLACGSAAALAAPAALASGSGGVTVSTPSTASPLGSGSQPSFNLNNAGAASALQTTTVSPAASTGTTSSGGGIGTGGVVAIAVVFAALMAGIIVLVRNDSRRTLSHLRHGNREDPMFATAHSGSKAHRKPRKLTPAERKRRKRGRAR